jgi:hypothetical protein
MWEIPVKSGGFRMDLINATKLVAGYTMVADKTGREWLVVVAKGTYGIPDCPDREPPLLEEQVPLVMTDVFAGEPGCSAPLHEIDFAPHKPRCDILLNGSAYAPGGEPTERATVSLKVGSMSKSFDVVGKRVWRAGLLQPAASPPEPFTVMPISYNNAFGGIDRSHEDPIKHRWYPTNHAGAGYFETTSGVIDGKPLPNTEETARKVKDPRGKYRPMAFGPVGRSWQPRIKWAGTYDQKWLDEKFPFLPDDFDDRYYQCAPEDQQTDYLKGGELVELANLTPEGHTTFRLPRRLSVSVLFFLRTDEMREAAANLDTLLLEPDLGRLSLVWRTSLPLRRTIREVQQIVVGRTAREWEGEQRREHRRAGKRRFPSLREMVESARKPSEG